VGEAFLRQVESEAPTGAARSIGYSLGGRLALHALRRGQPEIVQCAISSFRAPGLALADRMARRSPSRALGRFVGPRRAVGDFFCSIGSASRFLGAPGSVQEDGEEIIRGASSQPLCGPTLGRSEIREDLLDRAVAPFPCSGLPAGEDSNMPRSGTTGGWSVDQASRQASCAFRRATGALGKTSVTLLTRFSVF